MKNKIVTAQSSRSNMAKVEIVIKNIHKPKFVKAENLWCVTEMQGTTEVNSWFNTKEEALSYFDKKIHE